MTCQLQWAFRILHLRLRISINRQCLHIILVNCIEVECRVSLGQPAHVLFQQAIILLLDLPVEALEPLLKLIRF